MIIVGRILVERVSNNRYTLMTKKGGDSLFQKQVNPSLCVIYVSKSIFKSGFVSIKIKLLELTLVG